MNKTIPIMMVVMDNGSIRLIPRMMVGKSVGMLNIPVHLRPLSANLLMDADAGVLDWIEKLANCA